MEYKKFGTTGAYESLDEAEVRTIVLGAAATRLSFQYEAQPDSFAEHIVIKNVNRQNGISCVVNRACQHSYLDR